jgi:hypothetical protein
MPILECTCGMIMSIPQERPLVPCLRCNRANYQFEWKLVPTTRRDSILQAHDGVERSTSHALDSQKDATAKNSYDWVRTPTCESQRRSA